MLVVGMLLLFGFARGLRRSVVATRPKRLSTAAGRRPLAASLSSAAPLEVCDGPDDGPVVAPLDPYWAPRLASLERPAAMALASGLADNALGFPHASIDDPGSTKGAKTLLLEALEWKVRHRSKVLLVRVGEFYEAWGVDAVLLVEHCGLNGMGDKIRAGCPWRNLQATLDGLTSQGLSVAVYEEVPEANSRKKKARYLSQVVTPSSSTYVCGRNLESGDIEFGRLDGPKFVAVAKQGAGGGHTLVSLDVDGRLATVARSLTPSGFKANTMKL